MPPLKGLIILDGTNHPIVQSNFGNASHALQFVDALNEMASKTTMTSTPDCVFQTFTSEGLAACCLLERGGLRFLVPVTNETDPVFVFAFLQRFIDVLQDYIGDISSYSLKDNFDVVYQLLEEMLDGGYPLTTELNTLRDIILPPSFADKILSVAGVAGLSTASAKPFSSPIPWRKAGLKYNNNEIYFDVVEELDAIVTGGVVVSSNVCGKIMSNCRLSGTPDLYLSFLNTEVLAECAFHPCVRLQKWNRDKSLSFVPPDRHFVLMEYHYALVSATGNPQMTGPPFTLKPTISLRENGGDISITVVSRKAMSITVELGLGNGSTGVSCTCTVGGNWSYDPSKLVLSWNLGTITSMSTHTLKGVFTSIALQPRIASAIQAQFEVDQHMYSMLKIDQLKVSGENYKPYKGVRYKSRGIVEFRWNNDS